MPNKQIQSLTVEGVTYDIVDNTSGYINAQYIENKTDYSIPVSRVGEIVVGETAIGTDSTNFPTSKAVVDYVDERVVQEMDAIDVGVTGIKANGTSLSVVDGVVNIPIISETQSVGLMTDEYMSEIYMRMASLSDSIPTSTSQLTNDSGFITSDSDEKLATNQQITNGGAYFPIVGDINSNPSVKHISQNFGYGQTSELATLSLGSTSQLAGRIRLYNGDFSISIVADSVINSNKTITFPNKTGTIALTSDIPTVPTNISSFTNDSGYLTASDITSVMTYKGTKANYAALPSTGNTTGDVWHLTDTGAEWAWDGSAWQELGTAIDLSGYVPIQSQGTSGSRNVRASITNENGKLILAGWDLDDGGYLRPNYNGLLTIDSGGVSLGYYTTSNKTASSFPIVVHPSGVTITNVITPTSNTDAANKKYVDDSVGALSIPTKTSDLTNDSGYLTSYTETDPTVPSWAKQSSKPSYGLTEISETDDLRAIEGLTGTSGLLKKTAANTWTLDTNTYLTSYTETDPTVPSWAKQSSKPTYTAAEIGALPDSMVIPSKVSDLTNDSGFITSYTDEKLGLSLVSSPVTYYPILTQDTTTAQKKNYDNDGFKYYNYNGTTSAVGNAKLTLGNEKTATTAKNKQGTLELYGSTTYATRITAGAPTATRNIELPDKTGTVALISDIPTVPTKVSDLTNDSGFISSYTETDPVFSASAAAGITSTDISNWNNMVPITNGSMFINNDGNNNGFIVEYGETNIIQVTYNQTNQNNETHIHYVVTPVANGDAANKKYVDDSINAISIPTKTSDLTNDSNFTAKSTITATLTTTWSSKTQTVSVTGVTASNTVIITPAPASYNAYCEYGVYCSAQSSGTLTFTCDEVPTSSLTVNVLILN